MFVCIAAGLLVAMPALTQHIAQPDIDTDVIALSINANQDDQQSIDIRVVKYRKQ